MLPYFLSILQYVLLCNNSFHSSCIIKILFTFFESLMTVTLVALKSLLSLLVNVGESISILTL